MCVIFLYKLVCNPGYIALFEKIRPISQQQISVPNLFNIFVMFSYLNHTLIGCTSNKAFMERTIVFQQLRVAQTFIYNSLHRIVFRRRRETGSAVHF